jgi:hypothetical protein
MNFKSKKQKMVCGRYETDEKDFKSPKRKVNGELKLRLVSMEM